MTKSLPSAADRIIIGRIGAPHGIHGELRVSILTDFPERFADMKEAYADGELLTIESVKYHQGAVLLHFRGYDVREEAAKLTGKTLTVERSDAAPLSDGEYYAFDIIGLKVCLADGTELGEVTHILKTGSNDVYVTQRNDGGADLMIPALKAVVKKIDIEAGHMTVELPEGLE
jgi:16S rRNA processing protein RimM